MDGSPNHISEYNSQSELIGGALSFTPKYYCPDGIQADRHKISVRKKF